MNVHKIWLLLLFLLIPTILFAQKKGQSKDWCALYQRQKGEEPLPYASLVILEGKDSAFVKGVASDADGRFNLQFTPQKGTQYLLKASYTGMQSVFRKLDSNASTINLGSIFTGRRYRIGRSDSKRPDARRRPGGRYHRHQCSSLQNTGRFVSGDTCQNVFPEWNTTAKPKH